MPTNFYSRDDLQSLRCRFPILIVHEDVDAVVSADPLLAYALRAGLIDLQPAGGRMEKVVFTRKGRAALVRPPAPAPLELPELDLSGPAAVTAGAAWFYRTRKPKVAR